MSETQLLHEELLSTLHSLITMTSLSLPLYANETRLMTEKSVLWLTRRAPLDGKITA